MPENKNVGSYTFTVTREKKLWILAPPDCTGVVMADSLGEFIWLVLKKKLRFKK